MKKDMMIELFDELFDELVPSMGKADTVAGELIRATARLRYRFFNDGDKVLSGYGNETCNGSLRYITSKLKDLTRSEDLNVVGSEDLKDEFNKLWEFNSLWEGDTTFDDEYEEQLEICVEMMVKFVDENKDLKSITNEDDSTSDFDEPEDYDYYDDYEYDCEYDYDYDDNL